MVLLVHKLSNSLKLSSKLENHYHPSEPLSASLRAFRSDVSNCFARLSLNPIPGSDFLSLIWIQKCFELLPIINKAFAKLVVDIDYPMSKWEGTSTEEYLNYSLNLLELLNSISSAISHLNQSRVSQSHALSLIENNSPMVKDRLREIRLKSFIKDFKVKRIGENEERLSSGKEWVILQALLVLKSIGLWICGVVLSGLCGDVKGYNELRKSADGLVGYSLMAVDSGVGRQIMGEGGIVKEVREINEAVACLVSALANGKGDGGKELQRRLEELEKVLKGIGEEGDRLFSEVLAGRNELLDTLRQKKQ